MTTPSKSKPNSTKNKPLLVAAVVVALAAAGLGWGATQYKSQQPHNYARDVATPLEKNLAKAGAVKKCSNEDAGRGTDNRMPWFYAVYELTGTRDEAAAIMRSVASSNGYVLSDASSGINVEDNLLLADKVSKQYSNPSLEPGNVSLFVDVYESKEHNGEQGYLCGVVKKDNLSKDKTTVRFTINLPPYKQ